MRGLMLGVALGALGGCAMVPRGGPAPGAELIGRDARLVTGAGQASTLRFGQGGAVRALFGKNEVAGRWWTTNEQLCFEWAGQARTRECWPYEAAFRRGETRTITSDKGNRVQVTLL